MSSVRVSGVLIGLMLALSISAGGSGAVSASRSTDIKAEQPVSCYRELREALGTVLPGDYRGYDDPAVCAQVLSGRTTRAVSAPANRIAADARSCYFKVRDELGTVLPSRSADFADRLCAPGSIAQKP